MNDVMPAAFNYRTLDEVAETMCGVSTEAYHMLWALVRDDSRDDHIEDMGPSEYYSIPSVNSMSAHWSALPEAIQANLRRVAAIADKDDLDEFMDLETID